MNQGKAFGLGSERHAQAGIDAHHAPRRPRRSLRARNCRPATRRSCSAAAMWTSGLSLDVRYSLGRDVIAYVNLGGVSDGPRPHLPGAQSGMVQSLVALEYRPNNRDSYILQVDGSTRAVRAGNRFADNWERHGHVWLQTRFRSPLSAVRCPSPRTATFTITCCPPSATSARTSLFRQGWSGIRV